MNIYIYNKDKWWYEFPVSGVDERVHLPYYSKPIRPFELVDDIWSFPSPLDIDFEKVSEKIKNTFGFDIHPKTIKKLSTEADEGMRNFHRLTLERLCLYMCQLERERKNKERRS